MPGSARPPVVPVRYELEGVGRGENVGAS